MDEIDRSLLRYRPRELILAQTRGAADPQFQNVSARVLGLHPMISVAVSLAFRPNRGLGGFDTNPAGGVMGPTDATWSIYALARNAGDTDPRALFGNPLVTNNLLPDGFETSSSAFGLHIDATCRVDVNGDYGDWVLSAEVCPVDAELVLKCPDVIRALFADVKIIPLQPVAPLINSLA